MIKRTGILIIIFFSLYSKGQVNLVLNPSFEQNDSCPNYLNQIFLAKYWSGLSNNIIKESCWAELMHTCCKNTMACGIPYSKGGSAYQVPKFGNAMSQMVTYGQIMWVNERNYILGTLKDFLIANKNYCGKLFINLSNASKYKNNRFGMYFDNGNLLGSKDECVSLNIVPHITNNSAIMLDDTLGWMKIEGIYLANGTENKVTIGNFYSDIMTNKILTNFANTFDNGIYNIDDISLISLDTKAFAGNDVTLCVGDSVELGRPQEVGLECLWYTPLSDVPFSSNSNFTFKAKEPGTFTYIQKMDNCVVSFDTVTVTVVDDCFPVTIPNTFTPNEDGVNDEWRIELKSVSNVSYTIYNRWGNMIKNSPVNTHSFITWDGRTTSGEETTQGIYFYVLEYTTRTGDKKKLNGYISLFR